jgi:hypothetical protein
MTIKNNSAAGRYADAWWFLAKPGDPQPWQNYDYQSQIQEDVYLAPGESMELVWNEELAVVEGEYELSGWLHSGQLEQQEPTDGAILKERISLEGGELPYVRRNAPNSLEVQDVAHAVFVEEFPSVAPFNLYLPITVENRTQREMIGDVSWHLVNASEEDPFTALPAYQGGVLVNQRLIPGESVVTFQREISPRTGSYLLVVRIATEERPEGAWEDLKVFTTPLQVPANEAGDGIARVGNPSGLVSIVGVSAQGSDSPGTMSLRASLQSASERSEDVEIWWFLSEPAENEPWVNNDFESRRTRLTLNPGEERTIDISEPAMVNPGSYELSVWVHTVTGGADQPSDGVWWSKGILVP